MIGFFTVLPYLLAAGYLALIAWVSYSHRSDGILWLGLWNGAVLLVSLLVLPWITTDGKAAFDARAKDIALHPQISELLEAIELEDVWDEEPILYTVITCDEDTIEECLISVPDGPSRQFSILARDETIILGFRLIGQSAGASSGLRITMIFILVWSLVNLLWVLSRLAGLLPNHLNEGPKWILVIVGIMLMPLILWYLPIVDTLGYRDEFGISAVTFLAGAKVGLGITWTFASLLTSMVVILLSVDSEPVSDDTFS